MEQCGTDREGTQVTPTADDIDQVARLADAVLWGELRGVPRQDACDLLTGRYQPGRPLRGLSTCW